MSKKQTIRTIIAGLLLVPIFAVSASAPAYAADCGGVQTSIINCEQKGDGKNIQDSGLWGVLLMAVNILSAGVGVLALGGIVYGSILYTSAGGNPEQIKKAKGIFINVAVGVIAFAGMFALLNFLVPGGIFN